MASRGAICVSGKVTFVRLLSTHAAQAGVPGAQEGLGSSREGDTQLGRLSSRLKDIWGESPRRVWWSESPPHFVKGSPPAQAVALPLHGSWTRNSQPHQLGGDGNWPSRTRGNGPVMLLFLGIWIEGGGEVSYGLARGEGPLSQDRQAQVRRTQNSGGAGRGSAEGV